MNKELTSYFLEKRIHLLNNYSSNCGKYKDSCTMVAVGIAEILLDENKLSSIIIFSKKKGTLKPLVLNGITWGAHVVCLFDGYVYDPLFEEPIKLHKYSKKLFGEEVSFRVAVNETNIKEFVNRGK